MIIRMAAHREIIPRVSRLNSRWRANIKCQAIHQWVIQVKARWIWTQQWLLNTNNHRLDQIIRLSMSSQASGIPRCHKVWGCRPTVECLLEWNLLTAIINWLQLPLSYLNKAWFKHHKIKTKGSRWWVMKGCKQDNNKFSKAKYPKELTQELQPKW